MPRHSIERADRHLVLAGAYAEAARGALARGIASDVRLPYFALVAHALELALKAILIGAGRDEAELMMMGHDLAHARNAVERSEPSFAAAIAPRFVAVVDALTYPHAIQSFRYPQRPPQDLPDPSAALEALDRFLETAEQHLRGS